jgi:hypothetical protein
LTLAAPARATSAPARVEPVMETIATSGCAASAEPNDGALTLDEVEHTSRRTRAVHRLSQHDRVDRGELAGLEHHRAAGRDRRHPSRPLVPADQRQALPVSAPGVFVGMAQALEANSTKHLPGERGVEFQVVDLPLATQHPQQGRPRLHRPDLLIVRR